ncbi:MAG: hypothetical protein KA748_10525 [Halomonas sp.]|nr:hypothetical protein [Halomonas sp.]MBP5980631.1 hypothetical protein [Halomonas sp.]
MRHPRMAASSRPADATQPRHRCALLSRVRWRLPRATWPCVTFGLEDS